MKSTPEKKKRKRIALKEKVRLHINDKTDKITEEDLRDVIVGTNAVDLDNPDEPSITVKDIPDNKIVTPWDVLNKDDQEEPA
jgi:hypothetical protein